MAGSDVENLIQEAPDHRLPAHQAIEITRFVCSSLEFSHGKEMIHRYLRPSNIWLTEDSTVKIGDFGLVKMDDPVRHDRG